MRKSMVLIVLCSSLWMFAVSQAWENPDSSMQSARNRIDQIRTAGGNGLYLAAHKHIQPMHIQPMHIQPAAGSGLIHLPFPDILSLMPAGYRVATLSKTYIPPQEETGNVFVVFTQQSF